MFSDNEFVIDEFDCCLREIIVPILQSFIKKNQMSVRFYFEGIMSNEFKLIIHKAIKMSEPPV
jgi:hypothetical protein